MSALARLVPNLLNPINRIISLTGQILQPAPKFHSLTSDGASQIKPGGLFDIFTRTNIRIHFPRPSKENESKGTVGKPECPPQQVEEL
ncbi:hypothetical protein NQ314_005559 [Rhamnusium bicolor]|uniref:Uncharacterized protein n=1 Tax=Rhamnusium bicolor TaxID=1586634 RepID=A0AAV8ZJJ2_9CUCU|nr:hypothetical protein NQ314_005559 [Rhamnusium bicolor]